MKFEVFEMERMQSTWENIVKYNLSESGVDPVALEELLSHPADRDHVMRKALGYSQSNGTVQLRETIAALYPGASLESVLVTNGTSEANFTVNWLLCEPGDEMVLMMPNYMQIWGIARGFGAEVKPFYLLEDKNWAPDIDQLEQAVTGKTRLIAVCNPNNPTGAVLSDVDMQRIVEAARRVGAWLLADEVYLGAERGGAERSGAERSDPNQNGSAGAVTTTRSFWGTYEKIIVTNGLSKAYGLPGLRIGWIVSSPELIARLWSYRDYTTISPGMLSDALACIALRPDKRRSLFERTRNILNTNYPVLRGWIDNHSDIFSLVDPVAGAIGYAKYNLDIDSLTLVNRLREERSLLIVPGQQFQMGKYLRIGYGYDLEALKVGLGLLDEFISNL